MQSTSTSQTLRLRVFAGPNGSGKSTVIQHVRNYKVDGKKIDFGYYINADDIAKALLQNSFSFDRSVKVDATEFETVALASGLINDDFTLLDFKSSFSFSANTITLKVTSANERLAQIIADFLRKKYLLERKKFSFETVFSHPSKLDIMREAVAKGYKVYLYFVSTESPEINKFRVQARRAKNGHDVPVDKIVSRYFRSLDLLFDACQISYQVFFFDNSVEGEDFKLFAHFKKTGNKKKWDPIKNEEIPNWFRKYYSSKVRSL